MAAAASSSGAADSGDVAVPAVAVKDLTFSYGVAAGFKPILKGVNMQLPVGSRTLLIGDNGAGKSTLLRILAGRHLCPDGAVTVLGRDTFHATSLNAMRSYLGTDWGRRSVAFTGHGCALQADIAVRNMMAEQQEAYKSRRDELVALMGIDLDWRMHQLSDGQRRRVQIMLQLLAPVQLLLLDEITTDLDLITRQDFLTHLKHLGITIVYATHIFDGLDDWPTHLAYISDGKLAKFGQVADFPELLERRATGAVAPLLRTVEQWLRTDRDAKRSAGIKLTERAEREDHDELRGAAGNGYLSGRFNQGFN